MHLRNDSRATAIAEPGQPAPGGRRVSEKRAAQSPARAPRCRASLPVRLSLCLLSVVVTLLAFEGAARLFSCVPPPLLVNDPVVGTRYLIGDHGLVYVEECDRYVHLRFNRDGVRGPDVPYEKTPGICRVAVIGDSMIAAVATEEDQTLVRRLEKELNDAGANTGTKWEVLNFGISGSSTGQELELYRHIVRTYHPDVVICAFYVLNDLGDNCNRLTSNRGRIYFDIDDQGELFQLPRSANRARLTSWLNQYSRFYVWQKGAVQEVVNSVRRRAKKWTSDDGSESELIESGGQGIFCTEPDETLAHAWRLTDKLLETLHAEVEADGGRFILAVLPSGAQVCDDIWQENFAELNVPVDRDYPDRRLGEIATRIGAECVLMTDRFRAAAPHHSVDCEDEWLHYQGTGHFNDLGNEVAAEAIFAALVDPNSSR